MVIREAWINCQVGSIQRVSEKTSAFSMVIITDASLGHNDGKYAHHNRYPCIVLMSAPDCPRAGA